MGYEVDFLPVGENGSGDAICLRYGDAQRGFTIHVVDGGYVDTGQTVVDHINKYYGNPTFIDHVVLSHADRDHAGGLKTVLEAFNVGTLWMNRPWLYAAETLQHFHGNYTLDGLIKEMRERHPELVELEDIANRKGIPIREVFAGMTIGAFLVLAPIKSRYIELIPDLDRTPESYAATAASVGLGRQIVEALKKAAKWVESWFNEQLEENPDPTSASNESCVVQLATIDGNTLVLTADAGPVALKEAAWVADQFQVKAEPSMFQVPHHGSRRNVTPSVLDTWLGNPVPEGTTRGSAFCSVAKNKTEYPRKRVSNAFLRRGYPVICTRGASKYHFNGMPRRDGWGPPTPEPFAYEYEE